MPAGRSFKEYVKGKCYDRLYQAASDYVASNWDNMNLYLRRVNKISEVELLDATIERVYVHDLPDMGVAFDVAMELTLYVAGANNHYDDDNEVTRWIRISCTGDLSKKLDDWKICEVENYNPGSATIDSLTDSLVPYMSYDNLEAIATHFLHEYYPQALHNLQSGEDPVIVDPYLLADELGLSILEHPIREDASLFGQIYFTETEADLFEENISGTVPTVIPAKTIVVDPRVGLLRTVGAVNNTIIHECVHWVKHRKVFELERLYNENVSCISCEVVGGAASEIAQKATEQMEKQANWLTPRIQMPEKQFKQHANYLIERAMIENEVSDSIEVLEQVIIELAADFQVSRQAAKIRLVELGVDEAIGTFNYVDGHYVKPHSFARGLLKSNQTFTISGQDAAIERFKNPELREKTATGDYLFVDNHFVYNAPEYVCANSDGELELTQYALTHMDECCLIFDMHLQNEVREEYHTACFLNREENDWRFELTYYNGYQNSTPERQRKYREDELLEAMDIRKQMTEDREQAFELLLKWRQTDYSKLARKLEISDRTIRRIANGETKDVPVETAALICFGLNLHPLVSERFLEILDCKLKPMDVKHQWIKEALTVKYPESMRNIRKYLRFYGVELP